MTERGYSYLKLEFQHEGNQIAELEIASKSKHQGSKHLDCQYPLVDCSNAYPIQNKIDINNQSPFLINNNFLYDLPQILLLEETDYELKLKFSNDMISNYGEKLKDYAFKTLLNEGRSSGKNVEQDTLILNTLLLEEEIGIVRGTLRFNSYVGKSFFDIILPEWSEKIPFEVRSKKIDYLDHYKVMLEEIAEVVSGSVLDSNSPLYEEYSLSEKDSSSFYEDYLLLEHILNKNNFPSNYNQVKKNMISRLESNTERVPLSMVRTIDAETIIDFFSSPLVETAVNGPINGYIVPDIIQNTQIETIDTPENRLVKDLLESFDQMIDDIIGMNANEGYVHDRLSAMQKFVQECLSDSWMHDVGKLTSIPYNSTILQQKSGYREIFHDYLILKSAISVSFDDVNELLNGHNKKVHKLYEYWCYLKLYDILREISVNPLPDLITNKVDKKWNIDLKYENKTFFIHRKNKTVVGELYFQKKYPGKRESSTNESMRSYSLRFTPDYSLKLSIDGEKKFMIIHFDAKYKSKIIEDSEGNNQYINKNEDLNKMHTYRDGILSTGGAFVLYPGDKTAQFNKFNDDYEFPIIGLQCLNPGDNSDLNAMKEKINELIDLFVSFSGNQRGEFIIS